MDEPMQDIAQITRSAHQAAEAGAPVSECPYPDHWEAAQRWYRAYRARAMELQAEATT